ncbi:hypothetical protein N7492_008250 [Penicillium capsulatum]|uniref:Uncharacterized protein n=1 Tax=Penicillium capsulatum TaxID=69766 RepID=A0A9W9HRC6_9EURO|nr:hypothetical protein N7492_008250 [Penicillium capsulatum]KAJ6105659.1 hypothetical protein N7512_009176 [Penicillium capsulatum]
MTAYVSLEAFQALIRNLEDDSSHKNLVNALANAILSYHFLLSNSFASTAATRIQLIHYVVVEAKRKDDDLGTAVEQLVIDLEQAETESGRRWRIIFDGLDVLFYEYHANLPAGHRLIPAGPPSQPSRSVFHMRDDSLAVDEMMDHMRQRETPGPR